MTDPERLDLPSASNADRRNCAGSENLIRELRARNLLTEIPPNQDAIDGTNIHGAWADPAQADKLGPAQAETLADIVRLEALILTDWASGEPYNLLGREVRLWLRNGLDPVHSGQYDAAYITPDWRRALILDAKTLYGDVEPAAHNAQLRELVALFRYNYPHIKHFTVAILAPNKPERMSIGTYDEPEAEVALRVLRLNLEAMADPLAPRIPGRWCKYCPARLGCEEVRLLIPATVETLGERIERGEYQLPLGQAGAHLLERIKTTKAVIKSMEEAYKAELARDPNCLPGWHLRNGKKIRLISEVQKAFDAWATYRLEIADFLSATDLSISRLEERFGAAAGLRGRKLSERFNEAFAPLISFRQFAPELERDRQVTNKTPLP